MTLAPPQGPRRARRAPPGPTAARPVRAAARRSLLAACFRMFVPAHWYTLTPQTHFATPFLSQRPCPCTQPEPYIGEAEDLFAVVHTAPLAS
jgi:hypothetical protein